MGLRSAVTELASDADHMASPGGFSVPPTLALSAVLGLALLAAPDFFDQAITSGEADIAHLGGAAALVISVIAMGEVVRSLRWLAVPVGVVMAASVWLVDASGTYAVFVTIAAGAACRGMDLDVPRERGLAKVMLARQTRAAVDLDWMSLLA